MSSAGSVSHWISRLRAGDQAAAQPLWQRYFHQLVGLARQQLRGAPRRAADEEDAVLSAFDSVCRGLERQRFPQVVDRDDLWRLLVVITAHKVLDLVRHETRQKRGDGKVRAGAGADEDALAQALGPEPSPAFAAQAAEECGRLLDRLGDAELRSLALWKMEGYTTAEMAAKLGCVPRTVERRLRLIRRIWEQELPS
jgi:DNA-directed RNA polymerase specialized sigma24 family protein